MREAIALILALTLLAGCVSNAPVQTAAVVNKTTPAPTSVLANVTEPAELTAATFRLDGALAKGGPAYADGEPSIASSLDGALYVSFPGCDQGVGPVALFTGVGNACPVGPVYKSVDGGKTWKRLNGEKDGKLAADDPGANGDADVAVDSAGSIYVSNLGGGIETERSDDGGKTWSYTGNVVPKDSRSVDRNWLAAAGPGHVIENWMGGPQNKERAVGIVTTWDGGKTWSNVTYLGKSIGWEGSVQFAPDGQTAYIPFTLAKASSSPGGLGTGGDYDLVVGKTTDGGATWTVLPANVTLHTSMTSFHFSGMLMAPDLAITGDGHVVYVYSEEQPDPADATNTAAVVKMIASGDGGQTWSKPFTVSRTPSAIFPWAAGGAGDRVAITYFADNLPGDPDRTGLWDVRAAILDGVGSDAPRMVDSVIDANVHVGGICAEGGACFTTGSDRALLDYFECVVTPEGKLALVYPADPLDGGKYIEIRTAVQEGGSLLFEPASATNATQPAVS